MSKIVQRKRADIFPEGINKGKRITIEELALIARARKGDEDAMTQLIYVNRRFVRSLAKSYQDQGLSLEELICAGNEGLETACMKYDPSRGYKFISFAVWFVRKSIQYILTN